MVAVAPRTWAVWPCSCFISPYCLRQPILRPLPSPASCLLCRATLVGSSGLTMRRPAWQHYGMVALPCSPRPFNFIDCWFVSFAGFNNTGDGNTGNSVSFCCSSAAAQRLHAMACRGLHAWTCSPPCCTPDLHADTHSSACTPRPPCLPQLSHHPFYTCRTSGTETPESTTRATATTAGGTCKRFGEIESWLFVGAGSSVRAFVAE